MANSVSSIAKETSHTSPNTYYSLTNGTVTRSGSSITVSFKLTLVIGSGTGVGANWNRTFYVYRNGVSGSIYTKQLKSGSTVWKANTTYTFTITFTYDTQVYSDFSGVFYLRILKSSDTASGDLGSGVWDGAKSTSGGTVGQTFTVTADASNIVHVYISSAWKDAVPYVYVNGEWKEAQAYVYNGTEWKVCT